MVLHALDDLDDAVDVTKRFLLPFDLGTWSKLALVAFFVGIPGANIFPFNASGGGASTDIPDTGGPVAGPDFVVDEQLLLLVAAVIVASIVLGLLFLLVGSIMEFVLLESLRGEVVTIRRYWSRRWRQGLRLFGFRLVLGFVLLVPLALFLVLAVVPFLLTGDPITSFAIFLLLLPLFFLLALVVGLVNGFTTAFVVPIMILDECGVLSGWRRLWPTVRSQWKQYAAYAIMAFVLSIAAGILIGFAMAAVTIALLIPFALLGGLAYFAYTVSSSIGIAIAVLVVVAFLVALLVGFAFVSVPVVTYLRYYALLVLGDTNEDFDLVPGQRAAVREEEPA